LYPIRAAAGNRNMETTTEFTIEDETGRRAFDLLIAGIKAKDGDYQVLRLISAFPPALALAELLPSDRSTGDLGKIEVELKERGIRNNSDAIAFVERMEAITCIK
jgi:hypothetical protein